MIEINLHQNQDGSLDGRYRLGDKPVTALFTPLFEDDFSSGDVSKHNDFFRWTGSGAIPSAGANSANIKDVTGPQGGTVKAYEFVYGTWQELRFHLTESVSQVITSADADTPVQYSEVWISYDIFIPANYVHQGTQLQSGMNNKGFISLWQDAYSTNAKAQMQLEWWPNGDGLSEISLNNGGHIRAMDSVDAAYVSAATGYTGALAFPSTSKGTWKNYAFRVFAGSTTTANDGEFRMYVDGELKVSRDNNDFVRNVTATPLGFNKGYLLGYHNSGYTETTTFYITNFKFGGTKLL